MSRLLIADDDKLFCSVLQRALAARGFDVIVAHDVDEAQRMANDAPPDYAVVDLQMPERSGLELVDALTKLNRQTRIVVLTGYASIATAVEAVKLGATHYLTKPADADEIMAAFQRQEGNSQAPIAEQPMSVDRLAWEHIQKVLNECDGNVSATARRLGMHRRTLQRKLRKRPVKR